jgi:peptidoglycan hydrolase-like protein with peptidoglycan-binding domain
MSRSKLGLVLSLSAFVLAYSVTMPNSASAHPGGLNSSGCHAGSRPYHCHRSPSEMVRTQDGRNRLRCDLGSASRECTSARAPTDVRSMQLQLMRHCPNLPTDFADGAFGESTHQALRRFQEAYGLQVDGAYGPQTERTLAGPVNGRCGQ